MYPDLLITPALWGRSSQSWLRKWGRQAVNPGLPFLGEHVFSSTDFAVASYSVLVPFSPLGNFVSEKNLPSILLSFRATFQLLVNIIAWFSIVWFKFNQRTRAPFSSVQLLSHIRLFATPWSVALQASLSITSSWSLLKPMSIESVMPSNYLILCCPLLFLPSIFPSIRVFSSGLALCIRWPKDWSCSFSISPSNEYSGLISFSIDWLDLLAVQGTLKSLLQHHSSKASILQCSAFLIVQLSHPYMTIGKTIALTRWTFGWQSNVSAFNMLCRLVMAFLPRSKRLLISWLQSPFVVILEPKKVKSLTVSIFSLSICRETMRLDAMILVFWMLSQLFHSSFLLSSRGSLVPLHFLPLGWCHLHIWGYWYFSWKPYFQLELHPAQHFAWCFLHIS